MHLRSINIIILNLRRFLMQKLSMIYTLNTGKRNTFRGAYGEKPNRGGMSYSHQFIIILLHRQLREHLLQERGV